MSLEKLADSNPFKRKSREKQHSELITLTPNESRCEGVTKEVLATDAKLKIFFIENNHCLDYKLYISDLAIRWVL